MLSSLRLGLLRQKLGLAGPIGLGRIAKTPKLETAKVLRIRAF
jgi:hypothetical protein